MGYRFNGGNGAGTCEVCGTMVYVGHKIHRRTLKPFVEHEVDLYFCEGDCASLKEAHDAHRCDGMGFCILCEENPLDMSRIARDVDMVRDHFEDANRCGEGCVLCAHQRGEKQCLNIDCVICCSKRSVRASHALGCQCPDRNQTG